MSMTLSEQIKAMRREIAMRRIVYPRRVDAGKMTQGEANFQIEVFEDILKRLEDMRELESMDLFC